MPCRVVARGGHLASPSSATWPILTVRRIARASSRVVKGTRRLRDTHRRSWLELMSCERPLEPRRETARLRHNPKSGASPVGGG